MVDLGELFLGALACVLCLVFLVIIVWYIQLHKYYNGLHKLTGPPYIPVLGHSLKLKPNSESMKYVVDSCFEHNGIAKMIGGFSFALIVTDYKFMEFIFTSQTITKKTFNYFFLKNWLGTGLILSDGAKWRSRRRIITPAFHFQILNQFVEVFDSSSDILVNKLRNEVDDGNTNMNLYDFIPYCTLDALCETAMRTKMNLQETKGNIYMNAVEELTKLAMFRTIDPFKHSDFLYQFSQLYQQEKKWLQIVHGTADAVIKKRKEELRIKPDANENILDDLGQKKRVAFIDILMQSTVDGKPLSDEDIREEVETFMFAGHDTTSAAICFALYEIARNPEVQAKIMEEQLAIYHGNEHRETTMAELTDMKYLEMVIKEALRLYPAVPSIGREVTEDFEYDGMLFKKGLLINLFLYGLHRNPKYFPDPERFDPERFSAENYLGLRPFTYVPFSAGPRNCIGQKFAMLEMKLVIGKLIRNFELQPCLDHVIEPVQKVTMYSINGIIINLKRRR